MKYPEGAAPSSGFNASNRGVHGYPASYHKWYLEESMGGQGGLYWTNLMRSMGIGYYVVIVNGDSGNELCDIPGVGKITVTQFLLEQGIRPIYSDRTDSFPRSFTNWKAVEETAKIHEQYGMKPLWCNRNEPFDSREGWDGDPPAVTPESMELVCKILQNDMRITYESGASPGFPGGPNYKYNPFTYMDKAPWLANKYWYADHNYGKGRPVDGPYDKVNREGELLTEDGYAAALDDYADDPQWHDLPLDVINQARIAQINPEANAIDDAVYWRGWERARYHAIEELGIIPAMASTECGWVPRDRAGVGNTQQHIYHILKAAWYNDKSIDNLQDLLAATGIDIRWPLTTPNMVAKKTLAMYNAPSPFFAVCPWLLADDAMSVGGYVGWPYATWVGWAYTDKYDYEKPVIQILQGNPPNPQPEPDIQAAIAALLTASDLSKVVQEENRQTLRALT